MLHVCLYTICFVFCYTSWCFYAFSGTNLLTRRHSDSSLFSAIFVFQKSYTGNILEIGQNKSQTCYFSRSATKSEDETEGARGQAHPRVARPNPWPCHQGVRPAGPPPDAALPPIYSPRWEKPKGRITFPQNRYVSNVSIIFDAPCLFLHYLFSVSLHFMAFLCIFWN
jgi:hypothetical protein